MITSFLLQYSPRAIKSLVLCATVFFLTGCLTQVFALEIASPIPLAIPLKQSGPSAGNAINRQTIAAERRTVIDQGDFSYENITLTEDVTWRGTVLVRGYLVIAPQATLRIEPGTVVRFMKSAILRQVPRLVVMGRLQCNGTVESPVLFAPNYSDAAKGDWGGILFLASVKRNQCDNIRFEGADTAIESHFSDFSANGVTISRSGTGLILRDSIVTLKQIVVSDCETGLEAHDSELDMREGTLANNRSGIAAYRSSLALTAVKVNGSDRQGVMAKECRVKFNRCEFAENSVGAFLNGGEGQIIMSRFEKNNNIGLHLSEARIRVQHCLFANNPGDGMRMDDGRSIVWASAFSDNGNYNLANNGQEDVSAIQNWWGSNVETAILAKLQDSSKDHRSGAVKVSPWLSEKPLTLPNNR